MEDIIIYKCGLVMPLREVTEYDPGHFGSIQEMLIDTINEINGYNFDVRMVSEDLTPKLIQSNIVNNLALDDLVIVDASSKNPNVMFELGMRLTFDKPTIIIQDDSESFEFDFGSLKHLIYPRNQDYQLMKKFRVNLQQTVINLMNEALEKGTEFSQFLQHYGNYNVGLVKETQIDTTEEALAIVLKKLDGLTSELDEISAKTTRIEYGFTEDGNFEGINTKRDNNRNKFVHDTVHFIRSSLFDVINKTGLSSKLNLYNITVSPTNSRNFFTTITFSSVDSGQSHVLAQSLTLPITEINFVQMIEQVVEILKIT